MFQYLSGLINLAFQQSEKGPVNEFSWFFLVKRCPIFLFARLEHEEFPLKWLCLPMYLTHENVSSAYGYRIEMSSSENGAPASHIYAVSANFPFIF